MATDKVYKLYKMWYDDGSFNTKDWNDFYIAQNEAELKANSTRYKKLISVKEKFGGEVYIIEKSIMYNTFCENASEFEITFKKKGAIENGRN